MTLEYHRFFVSPEISGIGGGGGGDLLTYAML